MEKAVGEIPCRRFLSLIRFDQVTIVQPEKQTSVPPPPSSL